MKKMVLIIAILLVVGLPLMLVGCAGVFSISESMGFEADDIEQLSVGMVVNGLYQSKTTDRQEKINPSYELVKGIEYSEFKGDVYSTDWTDDPAYSMTYKLKGIEGEFEMIVVIKLPQTTANQTDSRMALIGFRSLNGFEQKKALDGFYTVEDSEAFLVSMEKVFMEVMSS